LESAFRLVPEATVRSGTFQIRSDEADPELSNEALENHGPL
jgi:hypothetical protein